MKFERLSLFYFFFQNALCNIRVGSKIHKFDFVWYGIPFEFLITWGRAWFAMNRAEQDSPASSFFLLSRDWQCRISSSFSPPLSFFFSLSFPIPQRRRSITLAVSMRDPVSPLDLVPRSEYRDAIYGKRYACIQISLSSNDDDFEFSVARDKRRRMSRKSFDNF